MNREASSDVELVGEHKPSGGAMVTRLLHEILLFYCMVAFVTGIVIAGVTLLG